MKNNHSNNNNYNKYRWSFIERVPGNMLNALACVAS